jgi:hypothetical protein
MWGDVIIVYHTVRASKRTVGIAVPVDMYTALAQGPSPGEVVGDNGWGVCVGLLEDDAALHDRIVEAGNHCR